MYSISRICDHRDVWLGL